MFAKNARKSVFHEISLNLGTLYLTKLKWIPSSRFPKFSQSSKILIVVLRRYMGGRGQGGWDLGHVLRRYMGGKGQGGYWDMFCLRNGNTGKTF